MVRERHIKPRIWVIISQEEEGGWESQQGQSELQNFVLFP